MIARDLRIGHHQESSSKGEDGGDEACKGHGSRGSVKTGPHALLTELESLLLLPDPQGFFRRDRFRSRDRLGGPSGRIKVNCLLKRGAGRHRGRRSYILNASRLFPSR